MSNDRKQASGVTHQAQMAAALRQAGTGIGEFLTLWVESLPPEEQERLVNLVAHGMGLGVRAVATGRPQFDITLTDLAGNYQVLTSVDFKLKAH